VLIKILSLCRSALKKTGLLPVIKRMIYRPSNAGASRSSQFGLAYRLKLLVEQANFASVEQVHDLPPIHEYWGDKFLTPLFHLFGFAAIDDFFVHEIAAAIKSNAAPANAILSIGSGNCDFEVSLASRLIAAGCTNFRIECMDVNAEMLRRGQALARSKGVADFIAPLRTDFNAWRPDGPRYVAVIANQSLHHVVNLEGLFDAIKTSLLPGGVFVISDMIGRNGHMRWPEALAIVNEYWQQLPPKYRYNQLLGTTDETYVNFDCSKAGFEGIRAQDILPLLIQRFHFKTFIPFGNVIDVFIDRGVGPNFDPRNDWDRNFIDQVHAADVEAMLAGRIKPTHLVASMTVEPQAATRHPDGLNPQACVRIP
jgi:SAM-dependent methyltransferase